VQWVYSLQGKKLERADARGIWEEPIKVSLLWARNGIMEDMAS